MPRKSEYKPLKMPKKSKIFKYKLPPELNKRRFWNIPEIKKVRELAEDKLSAAQIGKIINRNRGMVIGLCYREGIKLNGGQGGAPFGNKNRLGGMKDAAN
jgi:hypothetical protein